MATNVVLSAEKQASIDAANVLNNAAFHANLLLRQADAYQDLLDMAIGHDIDESSVHECSVLKSHIAALRSIHAAADTLISEVSDAAGVSTNIYH